MSTNGHAPPDAELPNLGILIKLMKLTTSSNDCEALLAMRKANEALKKFGGDWEQLLLGKVTVIGDPFGNIPEPAPSHRAPPPSPTAPRPAPPPRPQPTWQASPQPQPQPTQQPKPPYTRYRSNRYDGFCHKCGSALAAGCGTLLNVGTSTVPAWKVECPAGSCKTFGTGPGSTHKPQKGRKLDPSSLSDLV